MLHLQKCRSVTMEASIGNDGVRRPNSVEPRGPEELFPRLLPIRSEK